MAEIEAMEKMLTNGVNTLSVKENYVLPPEERPESDFVLISTTIPVIDLAKATGNSDERADVILQITAAAEEYGFFQIINHGVPKDVLENMVRVGKEFFEMDLEERARLYSEDSRVPLRVSTMVKRNERSVHLWREYLIHPCYPLEDSIPLWPQKPPHYREIAREYAVAIKVAVSKIFGLLSLGLGLNEDYLDKKLGCQGIQVVNYYPVCPDPSLTLGARSHSDPGSITLLAQNQVNGLQIVKDGKWVAVKSVPESLLVNVGDQLEVITNGKFKSVEHRAVNNSTETRITIPTFYGPAYEDYIAPAEPFVSESNRPHYKGYKAHEFMDIFWSKDLRKKCVIEHFKIAKE